MRVYGGNRDGHDGLLTDPKERAQIDGQSDCEDWTTQSLSYCLAQTMRWPL